MAEISLCNERVQSKQIQMKIYAGKPCGGFFWQSASKNPHALIALFY